MSSAEENLLESVIHITEERDKRSLIKVLFEVLSSLIDFDVMYCLQIPRGSDGKHLEIAESIPISVIHDNLQLLPNQQGEQYVLQDDVATRCINSREIITEVINNSNRIMFPIIVNNDVTGILDIYGHNNTANSEKLIKGFVQIYSNFLAIISDNEHDTLTGLLNRKTFDAQLSELILDIENKSVPFSSEERRTDKKEDKHHWVGILDIDRFKSINDNFGHIYGDEVLLIFSDLMKQSFRANDLLFRYGGEEFVVVLAPATESDAFIVFERFRQKLESFNFPQVGTATVSIGMVPIGKYEHTTTLLEHADQALYYAKEHGRNQVCNYNELTKAGLVKSRDIQDDIELF